MITTSKKITADSWCKQTNNDDSLSRKKELTKKKWKEQDEELTDCKNDWVIDMKTDLLMNTQ